MALTGLINAAAPLQARSEHKYSSTQYSQEMHGKTRTEAANTATFTSLGNRLKKLRLKGQRMFPVYRFNSSAEQQR